MIAGPPESLRPPPRRIHSLSVATIKPHSALMIERHMKKMAKTKARKTSKCLNGNAKKIVEKAKKKEKKLLIIHEY